MQLGSQGKKNLRNFHFKMVACTATSSTSPGPSEMTEVYALKKKKERDWKTREFARTSDGAESAACLLRQRKDLPKEPQRGANVMFNPTKKSGPGSRHQSGCIRGLSSGKLGPQGAPPHGAL